MLCPRVIDRQNDAGARGVYRSGFTGDAVCRALFAVRSRRQTEYRLHWAERFGLRFARSDARPLIWIHAVSLGETRAAEPLIDALAARYPGLHFLLTHMTPTGRAAGAEIAARLPGRILQTYLPYDLPYAVRGFLRAFQPVLGISVETEAWPNLVATAAALRIPMALVNARLSERSYQRSRRYAALMPGLLHETASDSRWRAQLRPTRSASASRAGGVEAKAHEIEFTPNESKSLTEGLRRRGSRVFCFSQVRAKARSDDPGRVAARTMRDVIVRVKSSAAVSDTDRSAGLRFARRSESDLEGSVTSAYSRRFDGRERIITRPPMYVHRRKRAQTRRAKFDRGMPLAESRGRRAAHIQFRAGHCADRGRARRFGGRRGQAIVR